MLRPNSVEAMMQSDHNATLSVILEKILDHIRHLSETIGARGSCTPGERQAAEYASDQLRSLGALDVNIEHFKAIRSTYWPFAMAFIAALIGSSIALLIGWRGMLFVGAVLNGMGAWAMFAETEFTCHWARWLLPRATSQNVIGRIEPAGAVRQRVVLCAHLDTHRTPVFYSSKTWHRVFSTLVGLAFVSMLAGALAFGLAALLGWAWMRWLSLALVPIQVFALAMCLHADSTPYSPGANDNASGVGIVLELARRLAAEPLAHTQVRLALTGCEEVAAYGMAAYLDTHAVELGDDTVYVILDEVGLGTIKYLSTDGLVLKHKTHPRALQLASQAASELPEIKTRQGAGIAYTDALVATRRGLPALTLCTLPGHDAEEASHWHQMSDTREHIDPQALLDVYRFTWQILQILDQA